RVELGERVPDGGGDELAREDAHAPAGLSGGGDGRHLRASQLVEGEVELENVDSRLAEEAERPSPRVPADQLLHGRERQVADGRDAPGLEVRVRDRDLRIDARAG